ncbi:hypothetical protein BGZ97_006177, partial [Linnemannia gamsii]
PAPVPVTEPEEPKVATKKAVTAKATKKAPAPRKAASAGRKKKVVESSDEFEPESDGDYAPDDSEDDDSDFDDSDDDADDVEELSGKMASIKIQPNKSDSPARTEEDGPLKTKINRTKSKIFSTDAVLAPPKNKTKSSSASGRPTGGFWVPAPAPVKLPESTIKALSVIKEKLLDRQDSDDAVVPITNPHDAPDKKPSGLFKYKVRVHNYLHSHEEEADPDSKRATVRRLFHNIGSLFKPKQIITDTPVQEENKEEKKPAGGMVTTIKPSDKRRGSQDSVDSITKNINDLSVKADDGDDEFPNQCHGFNTSGHRCKRKVKLDRPQEKGEVLMCHDHEVNDEDEVVVHIEGKGGVLLQWLDVSEWVNPNLPDYVQNKLRKAMERPTSENDKPGYIYAYQLLETRSTGTHTLFKVGRTDNVYRRMNEWSDKCGSPPILLEVFPEQGALAPKDENDLAETSKPEDDTVITGLRCRYAHRVERLIHIELKPFHDKHHTCPCKTKHMEWFMIPNQPGLNEKQQLKQAWAQVRRVIVHWMNYMERVYGPVNRAWHQAFSPVLWANLSFVNQYTVSLFRNSSHIQTAILQHAPYIRSILSVFCYTFESLPVQTDLFKNLTRLDSLASELHNKGIVDHTNAVRLLQFIKVNTSLREIRLTVFPLANEAVSELLGATLAEHPGLISAKDLQLILTSCPNLTTFLAMAPPGRSTTTASNVSTTSNGGGGSRNGGTDMRINIKDLPTGVGNKPAWVCLRLQRLSIGFSGLLSLRRGNVNTSLSSHLANTENDSSATLDEAILSASAHSTTNSKIYVDHIYSQLALLTELRILHLGGELEPPAIASTFGSGPGLATMTAAYASMFPTDSSPLLASFDLTLKSGLGRLETLTRLEELDVQRIWHSRISGRECAWMGRSFPRLRTFKGSGSTALEAGAGAGGGVKKPVFVGMLKNMELVPEHAETYDMKDADEGEDWVGFERDRAHLAQTFREEALQWHLF